MAERDSFVFYKEYKDVIDMLETNELKLQFYECMTNYVFSGTIDEENYDKKIISFFCLIKKDLDKKHTSFRNYEDRRGTKYRKWKELVLKRDNCVCQLCGKDNNLVVHHIIPFAEDKEKRFDVENGITLCKDCHNKVHRNER